jgi:hypothetical protein
MRTKLGAGAARFTDFLRRARDEALVLEPPGQPSAGRLELRAHVCKALGLPDQPSPADLSTALLIAMTSGLIHGARAVLEDIRQRTRTLPAQSPVWVST